MGNHMTKPSNKSMVDRLVDHHSYIHSPIVEGVFRAVDRAMYFDFEEGESIDPYDDDPWRRGNLHISAPCIYAKVVEALDLKPGMSFLNLGSGTGYLNTIIGLLVGPNGINHGIEFHSDVVDYAYQKLQLFKQKSYAIDKYDFVEPTFIKGNCLDLDPNSMKYDRIYLGAACLPDLENFMKKLIKPYGGILVMPYENHLVRYVRVSETIWETEKLMGVNFTLMIRRDIDGNNDNTYNSNDLKLINMPLAQAKTLKELCRVTIRQQLREKTNLLNPNLLNSDNISSRRKRKERAEREIFLRNQEQRRKLDIIKSTNQQLSSGTTSATRYGARFGSAYDRHNNNNSGRNQSDLSKSLKHLDNNTSTQRRKFSNKDLERHQANCNYLLFLNGRVGHTSSQRTCDHNSSMNQQLQESSTPAVSRPGTSSFSFAISPNNASGSRTTSGRTRIHMDVTSSDISPINISRNNNRVAEEDYDEEEEEDVEEVDDDDDDDVDDEQGERIGIEFIHSDSELSDVVESSESSSSSSSSSSGSSSGEDEVTNIRLRCSRNGGRKLNFSKEIDCARTRPFVYTLRSSTRNRSQEGSGARESNSLGRSTLAEPILPSRSGLTWSNYRTNRRPIQLYSSSSSSSESSSLEEEDYGTPNRFIRDHLVINWQSYLRIPRFENDLARLERDGDLSSYSSVSSTSDFADLMHACGEPDTFSETSWNSFFDNFDEEDNIRDINTDMNNISSEQRNNSRVNMNSQQLEDNSITGSISFHLPPSRFSGTDDDDDDDDYYYDVKNDLNEIDDSFDEEIESDSSATLKRKDNLLDFILEKRKSKRLSSLQRARHHQNPLPGTSSSNVDNLINNESNTIGQSKKNKSSVDNKRDNLQDQEPVARRLRSSKITTTNATENDRSPTTYKKKKSHTANINNEHSSTSIPVSNPKDKKQDDKPRELLMPSCSRFDLTPPKLVRRSLNQNNNSSCSMNMCRHKRKFRLRDSCPNNHNYHKNKSLDGQQSLSKERQSGHSTSLSVQTNTSRFTTNTTNMNNNLSANSGNSSTTVPSTNSHLKIISPSYSAATTSWVSNKQQRHQQSAIRHKRKRHSSSESSGASPSRHSYSSTASDFKCLCCIDRRRRCGCTQPRLIGNQSSDASPSGYTSSNIQQRPLSSSSLSTTTTNDLPNSSRNSNQATRQRRRLLFSSLSSRGGSTSSTLANESLITSSGSANSAGAATNSGGSSGRQVRAVLFGSLTTTTAPATTTGTSANNTSSDNNNMVEINSKIPYRQTTGLRQQSTSLAKSNSTDRHSHSQNHNHHHHNHHHHNCHHHHRNHNNNHTNHHNQHSAENQASRRFNKEFETRRRAERKRRQKKKRRRGENECERYHNHISGYIRQLPLPRVLHSYLNFDRNL